MNGYTPTSWQNGITALNATNMNHIEAGISYLYEFLQTNVDSTIRFNPLVKTIRQVVGNPFGEDPVPAENEATQGWSAAFGKSNKSTNYAAFTTGTRNENNGDSALVGGVDNKVSISGFASFTVGRGNVNNSESSIVGGYYNTSASDVGENLVVGTLLQANNDNQHIIGTANELRAGLRFAIGNGTYGIDPTTYEPIDIVRRNAFEVYKDGRVVIPMGSLTVVNNRISAATLSLSSGIVDANGHVKLIVTTDGVKMPAIYDMSGYARFTLGGTTIVNASLVPNETNTRDLGSLNVRWNYVYSRYLYTTDTIYCSNGTAGAFQVNGNGEVTCTKVTTSFINGSLIDSGGTIRLQVNTSGQAIFTAHILPDNNNTRTLGNSSKKWKEGHIIKLIDGTNEATVADLSALIAYAKNQGWIS